MRRARCRANCPARAHVAGKSPRRGGDGGGTGRGAGARRGAAGTPPGGGGRVARSAGEGADVRRTGGCRGAVPAAVLAVGRSVPSHGPAQRGQLRRGHLERRVMRTPRPATPRARVEAARYWRPGRHPRPAATPERVAAPRVPRGPGRDPADLVAPSRDTHSRSRRHPAGCGFHQSRRASRAGGNWSHSATGHDPAHSVAWPAAVPEVLQQGQSGRVGHGPHDRGVQLDHGCSALARIHATRPKIARRTARTADRSRHCRRMSHPGRLRRHVGMRIAIAGGTGTLGRHSRPS